MQKFYFKPTLLVLALMLGACATSPKNTDLLAQTQSDFTAAQNNPKVATFAPMELKLASDAMDKANKASTDHDDIEKIDQLAYLAKQQIAVTLEVAKQKSAEADVANSSKERDQMRLDQRTSEVNQANQKAATSKAAAQDAKDDTAAAERATKSAQDETISAQRATQEAQSRSSQLEAQMAALAAKKTERGMVITLRGVLFGSDQAHLTAAGMQTAQKLADVLKQNPERKVLIEGYADSSGADEYNQVLSERRANAVASALQGMGISAERISTKGYGEAYPVTSNATAQNRQMNRRVEIVLSDENGKTALR